MHIHTHNLYSHQILSFMTVMRINGYQPRYPCLHQCRPADNSQAGFQHRPYKDTAFLQEYPCHTLPDPPDPGYAHHPSPLQPANTKPSLTVLTQTHLRHHIISLKDVHQNISMLSCVWNSMRVKWQNLLIKESSNMHFHKNQKAQKCWNPIPWHWFLANYPIWNEHVLGP